MRAIIPGLLWIGNAHELQDVSAVLRLGVRAIVDLAANEAPVRYPRDIAYCRLPLVDGPGNDAAILRLAVLSAVELIRAEAPCLIACSAGMSRSPAIAAAALAIIDHQVPDEVLTELVSKLKVRGDHSRLLLG